MLKAIGFSCSVVALAGFAFADSGSGRDLVYSYEPEVAASADEGSIAGANCGLAAANCQDVIAGTGGNAADFAFRSWDDFRTPATGGPPASVPLTTICTWGLYFANSANNPFCSPQAAPCVGVPADCFLIGIYADDGANGSSQVPGTLIDELAMACRGDGRISASVRADSGLNSGTLDIYEYTLTVDADPGTPGDQPYMLDPDRCYWIEVSNFHADGNALQWAWSRHVPSVGNQLGNSRRCQDINRNGIIDAEDASPRDLAWCLSFALQDTDACVSATASTNITCALAAPLTCGVPVIADNHYTGGEPSQNVASNPLHTCMINSIFVANPGGPQAATGFNPVWFSFVAPASGNVRLSTCDTAERRDLVATIYSGTCGALTPVVCSDEACGTVILQTSSVAHGLTPGQTYLVQISATAAGVDLGPYDILLECDGDVPPAPANDTCATATSLTIGAAPLAGSTSGATSDPGLSPPTPCVAGVFVSGPGVWYKVMGDGNTLTASLCVGGDPTVDTIINVFCGGCGSPTCVATDDDFCGPGSGSQASWCSTAGAEYQILVTGFLETVGDHAIAVTSDGAACTPTVVCPVTPSCPGDRGDANCSGAIDFFDIDPFLQALFDLPAYLAANCGGSICAADVDCTGAIDFFDIDPFLNCLFSGCLPVPPLCPP